MMQLKCKSCWCHGVLRHSPDIVMCNHKLRRREKKLYRHRTLKGVKLNYMRVYESVWAFIRSPRKTGFVTSLFIYRL